MKKTIFLFISSFVLILLSNINNENKIEDSKVKDVASLSFDIVGFVVKHPVIKAMQLLKIIKDTKEIAAQESTTYDKNSKSAILHATLPNGEDAAIKIYSDKNIAMITTSEQEIPFSPITLKAKFNLKNEDDVANLDERMQEDFENCTEEVLDDQKIDHENYPAELAARIACLKRKGYGQNDRAYMRIKHGLDV
jgi:hypothetical protein